MKSSVWFLVGMAFLLSCTFEKAPIQPGNLSKENSNSSRVELAPGVFLKLKGLEENEFSLDDILRGTLVVTNESDDPYPISISGWPPFMGYTVLDPQKRIICYAPVATGRAVYFKELLPGDSISENVEWGEWELFDGARQLKVFSGTYEIKFFFRSADGYIKKEITIFPEGNRWDTRVYVWEIGEDSTLLHFYLRNRIPREATLHPLSGQALEIQWFNEHPDTLYGTRFLDFPDTPITIPGHSDWLYRLKISRAEAASFQSGAGLKIRVILHTEEGDFSADSFFL